MIRPLALCIGLRYTRTHRRSHFISFISLTSMIGIALGVAVLITVLSVKNGFDEQIYKRFFGMAPEVTVHHFSGGFADWQAIREQVNHFPGVKASAPMTSGQGLLSGYGQVLPVIAVGVLPDYEAPVTDLANKMLEGELSELQAGEFNIILGKKVAASLAAGIGDKLTLMVPKASVSPAGMLPRFKRFTVSGIFSAGSGFGFDDKMTFIHMADAQTLLQTGEEITGLRLRIDNIYAAPKMAAAISMQLPEGFYAGDWTSQAGAFFEAIKLEKTMLFFILTLLIAIAVFNLVSSLVMVVNDKQSDIAILRTMGAQPKMILATFIVQGSVVGVLGTFLGLVGGLLLAYNATEISNSLQNLLHLQLLSSNVHFVDYLPSKIIFSDVLLVCVVSLSLSFIATIYPAWRASRTQPAEALRYE